MLNFINSIILIYYLFLLFIDVVYITVVIYTIWKNDIGPIFYKIILTLFGSVTFIYVLFYVFSMCEMIIK